VLAAASTPLTIEEVEADEPRGDDVLVRVLAAGICHSDVEVQDGSVAWPMPAILGHEVAGVVEGVGPAVANVRAGDRVVCSWNPSCGQCFYCVRDQRILCEACTRANGAGALLDGTSRLRLNGEAVHHFGFVSGHAELAVVPEAAAIVVDPAVPADRACLIGCGVMTGVGAAVNIARVRAGATVAVLGCGMVGLSAIQGSRLQGAERILALDVRSDRLELAATCGATDAIDVTAGDVAARVRDATDGRGADYVFEAAGHEAVFATALECARPGGTVVYLGKTDPTRPVPLRWGAISGEKLITRSSYGGARPQRDFPWLARLYLDGKLELDALVTERLRLDEINTGYDRTREGASVRSVVVT
jgi:S-(hydroxymethyl)glutathione dehydrogenase/alcohol dehydrogenase